MRNTLSKLSTEFFYEGSEQVGSFGNPSSGSPQVWGFGGGGNGGSTFPNGHPQGGNTMGGGV